MISKLTQGYFVTRFIYKYLISTFTIVNVAIMYVAMYSHTANTLKGLVKSIVVPVQVANAAAVWLGTLLIHINIKMCQTMGELKGSTMLVTYLLT